MASTTSPGTLTRETSVHKPTFHLGDFCIDEPRPMKVVVIGAGFGGIIAGIRFSQKVNNLDLTIYEENTDVGGTWFLTKYPGAAVDIPSHSYQLTFEPKTDWSSFYPQASEVLDYIRGLVEKYNLARYIKLQHTLVHARYDEPSGKWHLTIRRPLTNTTSRNKAEPQFEEIKDIADVFLTATGALNRWKWPDIKGLADFQGRIIHTARWDITEGNGGWEEGVRNWGDKSIGVIGVGSSAVQMVPALQPKVKQLVNFARGRAWFSPPFGASIMKSFTGDETAENYQFTDEDKKAFQQSEYYKHFRRELESKIISAGVHALRTSPLQENLRTNLPEFMRKKLEKRSWIGAYLIPDYPVSCKRLIPGSGYLKAICEDNVEFVPTSIEEITPTGIKTVDGKCRDLDIIVCATGFETSRHIPFPIIGRNGKTIQSTYTPYPTTYLSVAVEGFPNWFQAYGPNGGTSTSGMLIMLEKQVEYAVTATLKLQRERLKSIEVKGESVVDFEEYMHHYFPTTVFTDKCRSWHKPYGPDGRIVALWPGTTLHFLRALSHPRWEDFNFEPLEGSKNRFHWFGNGQTQVETTSSTNKAFYLSDEEVDIPPVPSKL